MINSKSLFRYILSAWFLLLIAVGSGKSEVLNPVDRFNYVIGTQTFGVGYQFGPETRLVETAEQIKTLGSSVIKLTLSPDYAGIQRYIPAPSPTIHSLIELARDEPSFHHVLDMPFANFNLWTHTFANPGADSWKNGFSETAATNEYREIYNLATYLLTNYNGSGKTFYLGHWEGDGMLRFSVAKENDAKVTPVAVQGMIRWLTIRQQAVDDAKRDVLHHDVQIWNYMEVNHVAIARDEKRPAAVNKVLPFVPVDFVSYSAYDTSNYPRPENIKSALSYIESMLKPKPGIAGKRVFIGEYGYPLLNRSPNEQNAHTPEEQDKLSRLIMRTGLEWGCPFVLYWEMYNNEIYSDGRHRGYWLINDKGVKQPIYDTHKKYLDWAREFVSKELAHSGKVPSDAAFRRAAIQYFKRLK